MATGVASWSKTAATNASADSTVNWAEGMAPSAVNDSARAEMASVAKWRDDISGTVTTGGSSTAYTVTTNQIFGTAAAMSGAMIAFIPHATSGASPTLAVDGLTARAINQSTGVAVPTGALIIGTPYVCTYIHATTEFIIQGVLGIATVNDPMQVLSVDAGATVGPTLDLYRNSASPANSDFLGSVDFNGKDNGAAKQLYARLIAQITDVVAGTEDANVFLQAVVAGVLTTMLQTTSGGISIPGTLGVTGAGSVGGTFGVTGDVAINTNKLTIAASSGNTVVAGTLGVTGAITSSAAVLSSSASGGVGYSTGAGGAVTQATSKSTNVTLNTICGAITMNNQLMTSNGAVVFNMVNSTIGANDVCVMAQGAAGAGTFGSYLIQAQCAAGSANISVRNIGGVSLSEAIVLEFVVTKGVVS